MAGKERNHDLAIAALVRGSTMADAARAAGVSEATLYRWMKQEDFQMEYALAKARATQLPLEKLRDAYERAIDKLVEMMTVGEDYMQLNAARTLMDASRRGPEIALIEGRLRILEERQTRLEARSEARTPANKTETVGGNQE